MVKDLASIAARAAWDVIEERRRQVVEEGWTPNHDDNHRQGELEAAAACYASPRFWEVGVYGNDGAPIGWPWARHWWKPGDRRRMLVKAGALILAAIERIDRNG